MPLKILAAADLHLGRRPSRLPSELTDRIAARELGPAGAWERLVDLAVDEKVDALLLAGDVVEAEDDFFEAYAELHRGVTRLAEAGVRVFAVAGNHDTRVLPYLSDEVEAFELLGRGGEWESVHLEANGEKATLWGWSFPQASVREDPVSGLSFSRGPGPNLGLLHCDRDQVGSSYAPVSSRSLEAAGLDAWLLGHIHAPDGLSLSRPTGYLGSLTGLDPGEPGPRGAWLLTIDQGTLTEFRRVALAPLRWVRLEVSLDGLDEPEEARRRVLDRLRKLDGEIEAETLRPQAVGIRLTLTGRTSYRREVEQLFSQEALRDLPVGQSRVFYFVETLRIETLPEVDLSALARRDDPAGLLARMLELLEAPLEDSERRELVAGAQRRLERVAGDPTWAGLQADLPDDNEAAEWLRRAGRRALDLLLAQRDDA